ncbi:DUF2953 domain-containing protein [Siminovitchia fortis]|uniref:DUF2953 domain-containing protein n=1 Tax=Siminovitchia fortis TaxID=254758 RepID=A0A443IP77_9BACI|nr:DUF2953 domain-containing protein [Siminovitchia fortis]RWR07752.1 DUF2953 domain-containing protein [Siminovitchia fortis]WHY82314.1 DUF2953 domain-containing protein [Siminovitchia fortis]
MIWNVFAIASAILILIMAAVFISRIKVKVFFRMQNLSECTLAIHLSAAYGLVRIKRSLDIKKQIDNLVNDEEKSAEAVDKWQRKLEGKTNEDLIKHLKDPILEALKKWTIHYFIWRTGAGTGDAAVTGRLAGAAWSVKGVIEACLKRYIPMKKTPELSFSPFFQAVGFESQLSCMVSIRTGKAILTILGLYKKWKKLNNRRIENNGTSNQGFNDDSDGKFERNDRREYDRWRSG